MTMSAVMKVHIQLDSSSTGFTAVLKLYDRRFGTTFRERLNPGKPGSRLGPYPHAASQEAAYCDFVRRGEIGGFLRDYEQETRASILPQPTWSFLDGSPEGPAKYEAVTWHSCQEYFDQETRAYERLSDLQGKIIPRLYAQVRLSLPQDDIVHCPPDLLQRPETRQYFEVQGILMELVDGYELSELLVSPMAPSDPERWQDIIQTAVDGAHEINRQGVCMNDCSMYNVMVDKNSQKPFIVDLAQCWFKEEMYEEDEESSTDEEADDSYGKSSGSDAASGSDEGSDNGDAGSQVFEPDPEIRYWNAVRSNDNPGAIGLVVGGRVMREKGVTIKTRYPDYDAIIADIRRKREEQELADKFENIL